MAIHIIKDANVYWQTAADAPADAGFLHTISNEATVNLTSDALDVTTMGSDWRDFLTGLKAATVSLSGFLPSGDGYAQTVAEMWTGWTENRWIVIEPSDPLGPLPHFACLSRSVSMDTGMSAGEAVTFGAAINARENFWRAARIHSSENRPSGAQSFTVGDAILGTGAQRAKTVYLIFVLKGNNLASGKALSARWSTTSVTNLTGIFRPIDPTTDQPGEDTERMSIRKVGVNASGDMTLSILSSVLSGNLAAANGLNIYAVPA